MDRNGGRGRAMNIIGLIVLVVVGILVIGLVLKLLKLAIIIALCVGAVMFLQSKLGAKRIR
jgi:hypothetical protein